MSDDTERPAWLFDLDDREAGIARELADGLDTRIFPGENAMLSVVHVDPHSEGTLHSHEEEQWGVLLSGECTRVQDGDAIAVAEGDFWHTPGGVEHTIRTGDSAAVILDVFSPPRPEYREAGSGFGTDE
jgi:quercetin dioxygenase-like cupin family protein